jgi:hypothetical protein
VWMFACCGVSEVRLDQIVACHVILGHNAAQQHACNAVWYSTAASSEPACRLCGVFLDGGPFFLDVGECGVLSVCRSTGVGSNSEVPRRG